MRTPLFFSYVFVKLRFKIQKNTANRRIANDNLKRKKKLWDFLLFCWFVVHHVFKSITYYIHSQLIDSISVVKIRRFFSLVIKNLMCCIWVIFGIVFELSVYSDKLVDCKFQIFIVSLIVSSVHFSSIDLIFFPFPSGCLLMLLHFYI